MTVSIVDRSETGDVDGILSSPFSMQYLFAPAHLNSSVKNVASQCLLGRYHAGKQTERRFVVFSQHGEQGKSLELRRVKKKTSGMTLVLE